MKKECVAMLLAGGQGSRLYVLTGDMAKPAVPFGGKFRIIDFPLSNCANSGIDTVGVLTQYRPLELNSYIGNGQPWELDRLDGGVHILPPYQSATGASWYKGTANAIYQNIGFVDLYDPEYVAVLSGDHIYKMDSAVMLRRHKETDAACTIAVMEVPCAEASRFGIITEDGEDGSNHVSLLSPGAVDAVVDCTDGYFQLSMGSWISKSYVDILEDQTEWADTVTDTSYTAGDDGEYLVLSGNASPSFKAYNTSEKVTIRFYNTTGIELDRINSNLFSSMTIREEDGKTTQEFYKRDSGETIGYDISTDGNGNTTVFFNPKASAGSESAPLKNMTIVVDPGHGGLDGGAQGVLYGIGPVEKDITMAHALVLQNRLESLGAQVILAVSPDQDNSTKVEMTDRVELAKENEADFYISLHCNSIAANSNGLKPSGTEIYYYENNSKLLADSILEKITEYNNRDARKVIYGNFYVTRNTICPSMLVEMGFISNPVEYDELCSPDSMYQTANAIADALIEYVEE